MMGATMELEEHYSQLLGINSPWEIYEVELKVDERISSGYLDRIHG